MKRKKTRNLHLRGTRKGGQSSPLRSVGPGKRPYQLGQARAAEVFVVDRVPGGVCGGDGSLGGGGGGGHNAS
jgi:hypothetical protein